MYQKEQRLPSSNRSCRSCTNGTLDTRAETGSRAQDSRQVPQDNAAAASFSLQIGMCNMYQIRPRRAPAYI